MLSHIRRRRIPKKNPDEIPLVTEPSNASRGDAESNTDFKIYEKCCELGGIVVGIIAFIILMLTITIMAQVFTPSCPKVNGRSCNAKGTCSGGVCTCFELYSGKGCGDSLIPGIIQSSGKECTGHGFGNPVIEVPVLCYQDTIQNIQYGPGWYNADCIKYVTTIREASRNAVGLESLRGLGSIPTCTCYMGWTGEACENRACPIDEEGLICGGNGLRSVDFLTNSTASGTGCQCTQPASLFQPQYFGTLSATKRAFLVKYYYFEYSQILCGTIYQVFNSSGLAISNVLVTYSPPEAYKCYCEDNWAGLACTEGQCPFNPQTRAVCYGNGATNKGQGILLNTTYATHRQKKCNLICADDHEACNPGKCVYTQSPTTPLFSKGAFCINPSVCPSDFPLRCYPGNCVEIPVFPNHNCQLNYEYGSLDPGRLDVGIDQWGCPNITDGVGFTGCFENTTEVDGVIGYLEPDGVLWNNDFTITVDLGSPLIYFEFVIDTLGAIITNWDGQVNQYNSTGYISGFFRYNYSEQGNWITESETGDYIVTLGATGYTICAMSWNYTGGVSFPSNYTIVRLSNPEKELIYIFDSIDSSVQLSLYVDQAYVLIAVADTVYQPLWYHPSGREVAQSECLANPQSCSWYVEGTQVRSLDSTWYLCTIESIPIIQQTPCSFDFQTYKATIGAYLFFWDTCLVAAPRIPLPLIDTSFTTLERNYTTRTSWPFYIQFIDTIDANTTLQAITFLTQDRITYPCACSPSFLSYNKSIYNEQWYNEANLREASFDLVSVGDYLLVPDYSEGDKRLFRAKIVEINEVAETFLVQDPITGFQLSAFKKDVRRINNAEVLRGLADANLMLTPFRCPDGSPTTVSGDIIDINVDCNCTFSALITNCSCADLIPSNFGCQCNTTMAACQCGPPANPDFERTLWNEINSVSTDGCECLIYTPTEEDLQNTTLTITDINAHQVTFLFAEEQIITHVVVKTTGSGCEAGSFDLYAGSTYFTNVTISFAGAENIDGCEHWITLYLPQKPAYNNLTVVASHVMDWSTLLFSVKGFSLFQTSTIPTFTASSNSGSSANVNLLNTTYWTSVGSMYDLPVWLEVDLHQNFYVDFSTMVFYKAGIKLDDEEFPLFLYFQGWHTDHWVNIGNVSVFVEEGGWVQKSIVFDTLLPFNKFRLITNGGQFAMRQWWLYSNQECSCVDGTDLIMNLDSVEGLKTIQDQLDEIQFFLDHIDQNQCVCENNCTIKVTGNKYAQGAYDGVCEDAYAIAIETGLPYTLSVLSSAVVNLTEDTPLYKLYTWNVFDGIDSVQFVTDISLFIDTDAQILFYPTYLNADNTPYFPPTPSYSNSSTVVNGTIYYLSQSTLAVIQYTAAQTDLSDMVYINDSYSFTVTNYTYTFGNLVEDGIACTAGYDCADCGPFYRDIKLMPGYTCSLTSSQSQLQAAIQNTDTIVNRTYYISNFTELTAQWTAIYQNIRLTRKITQIQTDYCPRQSCPTATPFMCPSGKCVQFQSECLPLYNCPGNGCVQQTDASVFGNLVYRCACAAGFGGDACQYDYCLGATPYFRNGVPGAVECTCGGIPPLRELPPIVNIGQNYKLSTLVEINNKITGNSAPKSALDVSFLRIKPQAGGWGRVVRYEIQLPGSDLLSTSQRTIYTTCSPARMGFYGEAILLDDDVLTRNPLTGQIIWYRSYINPLTGAVFIPNWTSIIAYNDFPFRCKNGQCVPNESYCYQSELLYKRCNGRGKCRVDGSCDCDTGYRTFSINDEYSNLIKWPSTVVNGIPDPTVWEMNYNWRYHGLNYCTARNCDETDCTVPTACFPGNLTKSFENRLISCPVETGRGGLCARSLADCRDGISLELPLVCSGNGIPRIKDITGEWGCVCMDPISTQANVTELSSITQGKKNGWGDPLCNVYYAKTYPIVWSRWNFELDAPYRSIITREILFGKWVSGNAIVGPDPDDKALWDEACGLYDRLEKCPNVPCRVGGNIIPMPAAECADPLVYYCNNHGIARADGTCLCDTDREAGTGYTHDLTQFSTEGCYKEVSCGISKLSGKVCNRVSPCSEPEKWVNPLPYDIGIDQQWWICGLEAMGMFSNLTRLDTISNSFDQFNALLLDALSDIAIAVIEAINGLASCICVYPTDTVNDRCCMLSGGSFIYDQNYPYPYFIDGYSPGYPNLTDRNIENMGNESYVFADGEYFDFIMNNADITTISVIRLFGKKVQSSDDVQVRFTSDGVQICPPSASVINTTTSFLEWVLGDREYYACAPTFTCYVYKDQLALEYAANCVIPESSKCVDWKSSVCIGASKEYWPLDSPAVYQGCTRGQDTDGCTCCLLTSLFGAEVPITDGVIRATILGGSLRVGQIQYFAYTGEALTPPAGLTNYINSRLESSTTCRDYKFYGDPDYLGSDGSYYTPTLGNTYQQTLSRDDARAACNYTGGWLAISDTFIENAGVDLFWVLQRACGNLNSTTASCWVGARDIRYYDEYVVRSQLMESSCTTCYLADYLDVIPNYGVFRPISFSTYPLNPPATTTYKVATFAPTQLSTLTVMDNLLNYNDATYYGTSENRGHNLITPLTTSKCTITFYFARGLGLDTSCIMEFPAGSKRWGFGYNLRSVPALYCPNCGVVSSGFCPSDGYQEYVAISTRDENGHKCARIAFYPNDNCNNPGFMNTQGNTQSGNAEYPGYGGKFVYLVEPTSPIYVLYGTDRFPRTLSPTSTDRNKIPTINGVFGPDDYGNPYSNIAPSNCVRFFPLFTQYKVAFTGSKTTRYTRGTYGVDFAPGLDTYPYLPAFINFYISGVIDPVRSRIPPENNVILADTTPIYFTGDPTTAADLFNSYTVINTIPLCTSCQIPLVPTLSWEPFSFYRGTWPSVFTSSLTESIWILYRNAYAPLSPSSVGIGFYTHQITFLVGVSETNESPSRLSATVVPFRLTSCLVVNAAGPALSICEDVEHNYVCQYDWVKYTVIPGYQCDVCGPNSKTGGAPNPGETCYDAYSLANATLFPEAHAIARAYQTNTLDIYAESFNLPIDGLGFGNISTIWGFPLAWTRWASGFTNRAGYTPETATTSTNWCNLNIRRLWPVDCGSQRSPVDNTIVNRCAVNRAFCDLNTPIPENARLSVSAIPPIYSAVDPDISFIDSTCGFKVRLEDYNKFTKDGGIQDSLDIFEIVLSTTPTYIQLQFSSTTPLWFNGGKAVTKYVFAWNDTSTISGTYILTCSSCTGAYMEVFIHPLSVNYTYPTTRLIATVPLTVSSTAQTYAVTFEVTSDDTGISYVNGEAAPTIVFRGVGYNFYGLDVGSSMYLYNPTITTNQTRAECENRTVPDLYETKLAITSSAPRRECILTEDDQLLFPGSNIGECACDLTLGGPGCDCPKVVSKYDSTVCGGFGDPGVRVLGADSNTYTTGTGDEAGCYVLSDYSECKTIDLGRWVYTLLTPGAAWNYPRVFIDISPLDNVGLFFVVPNTLNANLDLDEITDECEGAAARVPYEFNPSELVQLLNIARGYFPLFVSIGNITVASEVPWVANIPDTYFINGIEGTYVAEIGDYDCVATPSLCTAINSNNYAYGAESTSADIIDGNTITEVTVSSGTITWSARGANDGDVYVYIFTTVYDVVIDCSTGGFCTTVTANFKYICNCPNRRLTYTAGTLAEIQIFKNGALMRFSAYAYN